MSRLDGSTKLLSSICKTNPQARFSGLKDAVRAAFPGLGEEDQRQLEKANSLPALSNLFASVLEGTRRVRFYVGTLFRKKDDGDKKDDDDDKVPILSMSCRHSGTAGPISRLVKPI